MVLEHKINGYGFIRPERNLPTSKEIKESLDLLGFQTNILCYPYSSFRSNGTTFNAYTYSRDNTKTYKFRPYRDIFSAISGHFFEKYKRPKQIRKTKKNEHVYGSFTEYQRQNIFLLNKTISLRQKKDSNILCLDIDSNLSEYLKIKETYFPRNEELLVERSKAGRLHVYLLLAKSLKNTDLDSLAKKLKVDIRTTNRGIRLPNSFSYKTGEIINGEFVPFTNQFQWIHTLSHKINSVKPIEINIKQKETKKPDTSLYKRGISSYSEDKLMRDFPFGRGERYNTCLKIFSYGVRLGLPFDKIYEATLSNDQGSYDIAYNISEHKRNCKGFFEHFQKTFDPTFAIQNSIQENVFYSNIALVKNNIELSRLVNMEVISVFHKLNKKISSEYWRKEYKKAVEILFKEMIGYMIFDIKFKKKTNPCNSIITTEFFKEHLLKGFQFSSKYLDLLKKHYGLKVNVRRLFNFIMSNSLFFTSESKYNFRNSIKYCKQYFLKGSKHTYKQIIDFVSEIIEILKKKYFIYSVNEDMRELTRHNWNKIVNFLTEKRNVLTFEYG